jgi:hypothetical protein
VNACARLSSRERIERSNFAHGEERERRKRARRLFIVSREDMIWVRGVKEDMGWVLREM